MDEKISKDIAAYGWTILAVEETDYLPSFAFTLGLWQEYKHPELICFGLPVQTLQHVLNLAGELVKNGKVLETGRNYDDFFETGEAAFLNVDPANLGDYFGYVMDYYKDDHIPAMQLVWQDRQQQFPWADNFEEEFRYRQPLLDRNMDFKFSESADLAVFTSRQFIEDKAAILSVVHDAEGEWQFLTGPADMDNVRIVSLKEMLRADPSLNQFFNLDLGERAERASADAAWERSMA